MVSALASMLTSEREQSNVIRYQLNKFVTHSVIVYMAERQRVFAYLAGVLFLI